MNNPKTLHAVRILTLILGLSLSCSAITYYSITGSLCISSQFIENIKDVITSSQCAFLCDNRVNCQAFTTNDGPCELFVFERCSKPVRNCSCTRTGQVFVKQQPGLAAGALCLSGRIWAANLTPEAKTNWGVWGSWEYCADGAFVSGFQLKVQDNQGAGDDTALNSVKMFCSHDGCVGSHSLESAGGQWGNWRNPFQCSTFYTGIQFRSQPGQGSSVDDTAGNNVRLLCDGNWHDGGGLDWGVWTAPEYCPANSAICALRTNIEPPHPTDNTSLNKMEVQCCYFDSYIPF